MTIHYPIRYCLWQARRQPVRSTIVIGTFLLFIILLGTYYGELWDGDETPALEATPQPNNYTSELSIDANYRRPVLPLNCTAQFSQYPDRYCTWHKNLRDCLEILHEPMKEAKSWVFLGGPEMATLAYYVSKRLAPSLETSDLGFNLTSRRNPCQNLLYYRLPPPNNGWVPPDPSKGEGPFHFGLDNPYCMDCKKCWNVMMEVGSASAFLSPPSTGTNSRTNTTADKVHRTIEYLVVEYARDVSIQTQITKTTQETAAYYLGLKRPEVCVVSVGIWDAAIDPPISQSIFVSNVDRYISLLQRACHIVVWISIPAVVEDESIPQTNCQLQEWNTAVIAMLGQRNFNNVYVIDIWDKSLETDHKGYVELSIKWHASLSRLFVTVMAGQGDE